GIGVSGDGRDVAVRKDLIKTLNDPDNPHHKYYTGPEEHDFDEAVALAGARDFMAPPKIRATQIFLAGLRFPFTFDKPAASQPDLNFAQVQSILKAKVIDTPVDSQQNSMYPVTNTFGV